MPLQDLNTMADGGDLAADVVIVGAGACGLTLARGLSGYNLRIVVLESGGQEQDAAHETLNEVEVTEGSLTPEEQATRDRFHRSLTRHWDGARQGYGVRIRGLGGSTQAWAGKSAPFDAVDYAARDWVPMSGWPITQDDLAPYLLGAADLLNLGPPVFDHTLWARMGRKPPSPSLEGDAFRSIFWQFARSRRTPTDIMRFGADFQAAPPVDALVVINATVSRVLSDRAGRRVTGVEALSLNGNRLTVTAPVCVLAASAIENARLLLLSRDADPAGLGNGRDQVGRCLMDHPTATIARARPDQIGPLAARFGLFGFREAGRTVVSMHGMALREEFQRAHKTLNGAVFVTEERAPDDPFSALRRLLRRQTKAPFADLGAVLKSPVRLGRGAIARGMERGCVPAPLTRLAVDVALRLFPNTVAQDYRFGKLPLKLSGLRFEATTEQAPDPSNRITLSENLDALGLPRARITWRAGTAARSNLLRIGLAFANGFRAAGLPPPEPADWVSAQNPGAAVVIDLGHSLGTTRMSADAEHGVVDTDCAVHGVSGLYIAGGSVFPTSGHANPTLMMLALTLRLAKTLRHRCLTMASVSGRAAHDPSRP